jgi:hypothetical protein
MLAEKSRELTWLRIYCQAADVGIDRNMHHLAIMARGSYVWQLGDDDLIESGILEALLRELTADPLDLLILQGRFTTPAGAHLGDYLPRRFLGLRFTEAKTAFSHLWDRMKYGSFIVSARMLAGDWTRYYGTHHAYAGVVWDQLTAAQARGEPCRLGCGRRSMVRLREAPKSYSTYRCQVLFRDIPQWFVLLPAHLEPVRSRLLATWLRKQSSMRSLLRHRRSGQLSPATLPHLMAAFTPWQRFKAGIIIKLLPGSAVKS